MRSSAGAHGSTVAEEAGRRGSGWRAALALAVVVAAFARTACLIDVYAVDLMVYDQFDFLVPLFDAGYSALDKFRFQFADSPHRMGVGWAVIEASARLSDWSTRADAVSIAIVLALAAVLALWLMARLCGRLGWADLVLPVVFLGWKQWGTFIDTPDASLAAVPVLLLVAMALALTLQRTGVRVAALLLLDLACVYTGFAMFAGLLVPVLLWLEWRSGALAGGAFAAALAGALAIGLSFFIGYDARPALGPAAAQVAASSYLQYATGLYQSFFHAVSGPAALAVALSWPLLLLLPLLEAGRRIARGDRSWAPRVVLLLSGYGLCFVAANTLGRVGEGVGFAFMPRYVTLMLPGMLGVWVAARCFVAGTRQRALVAALALALLLGEWRAGVDEGPRIEAQSAARRAWKSCYRATHDFDACNAAYGDVVYPHHAAFPRIRKRLAQLEARRLNLFAEAPPALAHNILLVSIDTLRADHLGAYGYARDTSPHLDALARRGVLFETALSTSSWTLPAHASLLTGLEPWQHTLQDDGTRLPARIPTLAAALGARGFYTFAVVSHVYVASPFGLDRGFAHFDDEGIAGGTRNPTADESIDRLLTALDARPADRPFFAFLHLFDPHWDYSAPGAWGTRFVDPAYRGPVDGSYEQMRAFAGADRAMPADDLAALVARYDGEIAFVDAQLGRLFAALRARGLEQDTLIVVTGDHGEEFEEHRRLGHGRTLFEEQLRVPLILAGDPRLGTGVRWRDPVSLVDVAPTLLALFPEASDASAGAQPGEPAEPAGAAQRGGAAAGTHEPRAAAPGPAGDGPGRALLPGAIARGKLARRTLFAESQRFGIDVASARNARHKLIEQRNNHWRLFFDLERDPGEQHPSRVAGDAAALARAFDRHAELAEAGWHLQLVARGGQPLHLRLRVRTTGRLIDARHTFSERVAGSEAHFDRFALSDDARELEVDVRVRNHMGRIRFATLPPGAPVAIGIEAIEGGGAYWATGAPLPAGGVGAVAPQDARVHARLPAFDVLRPGVYVRAQPPPARGAPAELDAAARAHLEALGYLAPTPDE